MKSTIATASLAQLARSPLNVRETKAEDPAIAQLAASILAQGLISPLVVHKLAKPKNALGVLAGDRRWQAILKLEADSAAFDFDAIPVLVLDGTDAELTEVSLAENYVRQGMRPPEIYAAFRTIKERNPAIDDAELGRHYGLDPRRTARIMRLAFLHPTVFDAYAGGKLDDEQAFAYAATADQDLQLSVFERLKAAPRHDHYPRDIRAAMNVGSKDHRALLTYVGLDIYELAGGRFEIDLFAQEENSGRVMDEEILARLANEKIAADRDAFERLLQRGTKRIVTDGQWGLGDLQFAWASEPPQITQHGYSSSDWDLRLHPKRGKLDDKAEAEIAKLKEELGLLGGRVVTASKSGDEAEWRRQCDGHAALNARIAALEAPRSYMLPKKGAVVGVSKINPDGHFHVELWYASRKEKGLADPSSGKAKGATIASPAELERKRWGLTKDGMQAMLLLRRDMIREQLVLTAGDGAGLDFLIFSQARTILRPIKKGYGSGFYTDGAPVGIATPACQDEGSGSPPSKVVNLYQTMTAAPQWHAAWAELREANWVTEPDPVHAFVLFDLAPPAQRDLACAIVAGWGLLASTSFHGEGRTPRMIEELANQLETEPGAAEWALTVTYDEPFFALLTHKARIALINEWGLADHAKLLKKDGSAAFCARVMQAAQTGDDAELARLGVPEGERAELGLWRPEWLDTRMVEPLPVPSEDEGPVPSEPAQAEAGDDLGEIDEEPAPAEAGEIEAAE